MKLIDFANEISALLNMADYDGADSSLNGVQVGDLDSDIKKVAFAVDASLETITQAAKIKADLLFVHHGLFWGSPLAVTGSHYRRIKTLLDGGVGLFACHLPLDAHPLLGNNAQMALKLGLEHTEPFAQYHGKKIGWAGTLREALTCEQIIEKLGIRTDAHNVIIRGGKEKNSSVGIVSGGAALDVDQAMDLGLDAYITGENSHQTYHPCMERGINMLCLGHYETETFGVKAVMRYVSEHYGLETCFIDIPTTL